MLSRNEREHLKELSNCS